MANLDYPIRDITLALRKEEGFRAHVYKCSANKWTIGYGRNVQKNSGPGITKEEANYLLACDIQRTISECEKAFPFMADLNSERLGVMVQLCFQMGLPALRKFRRMLHHLDRGEYKQASEELLDSRFAKQTPARAKRLAKQLRGDDD